jgi:DNA segregation ATPase FtsK/SpoIIIE, S-DNA-T family
LHCYYPEVCLGYKNQMAELLAVSYSTNDYVLMERPLRDKTDTTTHEDPSESAERIALLVQRYLELMPHEKANLSIALYNCDSIRLPQAVVARLSEMLDNQQESRCQIVLRHSDARELSELYRHLLEVRLLVIS